MRKLTTSCDGMWISVRVETKDLRYWCPGPPTFISLLVDIRTPTDDGGRLHNR